MCAVVLTTPSLRQILRVHLRWMFRRNAYKEIGMNKDQVKGRVEQVKGKVKQVAGALVGNKSLEQRGKVQKAVGKVEAGIGDLKEDLKKGS